MGKKRRGSIPTEVEEELAELEIINADAVDDGRIATRTRKETECANEDLALRLAALADADIIRLELGGELESTVLQLAHAGKDNARRRLVLRVKTLLRYLDTAPIESALIGRGPAEVRIAELERTRKQLVNGTDADLFAFSEQHPTVDRGQLRQLVRQSRGEGAKARRAFKSLFQVLKDI